MPAFPIGSTAKARTEKAKKIAQRCAAHVDTPPQGEGVVALNPGFFQLQRMREKTVAKAQAKVRTKVSS